MAHASVEDVVQVGRLDLSDGNVETMSPCCTAGFEALDAPLCIVNGVGL